MWSTVKEKILEYVYAREPGVSSIGSGIPYIPDTVRNTLESPRQEFSLDTMLIDARVDIDDISRTLLTEVESHPNWQVFDASIPVKVHFSRVFEALQENQKLKIRIIPKQAWEDILHDSINYSTTFNQVWFQINLERMEYTDDMELLVGWKVIGIITGMDGGMFVCDIPKWTWKKRTL